MCRNLIKKKIFLFWIAIWILVPCQTFWFDLFEEIDLKVQSIFDWGSFDEYLNRSYNSEFSKDPFWEAMSDISDMSNKMKKSGEDYVKQVLYSYGCSMSNKEIRWILYSIDEYRADIARSLKIEQWKYGSKKYEVDDKVVKKYCEKFNKCGIKLWAANMETKCDEFFKKNYKAWEYNELLKQNVQTSWLWTDKYRNNTTDDSPYDVIEDLGVLSKLLYEDAQDPIKPVFYDIPAFSKSKEEATQDREVSKSSDSFGTSSDKNWKKGDSFWGRRDLNNWDGGAEQNNQWDGWNYSKPSFWVQPLDPNEISNYDELLEWLGAYRLTSDGTDFYTNLCDNREEQEVEVEGKSKNDIELGDDFLKLDDLQEHQYQEVVNYMVESVNSYLTLPPEKQEEIGKSIWDMSGIWRESSVEDLKTSAQKIKDCWSGSCYWLWLRHIDEMASCMVKCACWEINSPIFDPEKLPGLWPIFMIRFCAVPAVNTKFSVWWKRIHSIEEWVREIYWVVDKLSREWRLWKRTQQYEFLDASTKRIYFADEFAYSIDVELVNIWNRRSKQSKQYQEKELKIDNENEQKWNGVKNPLDTSYGKNYFKIVPDEESRNMGNINWNEDQEWKEILESRPSSYSKDVQDDEMAIHHVEVESYWDLWLDQQWELRKNVYWYIENLNKSSELLKNKKKCK